MSQSTIYERVRKNGEEPKAVHRSVRDVIRQGSISVGRYVAFHKVKYCIQAYLRSADTRDEVWFEVSPMNPLVQMYKEDRDGR